MRSLLFLVALIVVLHGRPGDCSAGQPNIVLLFADDAGYGDFGFHGSQHFKTPHLDRLAESGAVLSQFYVTSSVCGCSRAGMLTGKYAQRFGFEENNVPGMMSPNSQQVGDQMGLPTDLQTMGDHLQRLGYRTAIFGKWHQGNADRYHPLRRGFDEFYGFRGGARSFFAYDDPCPPENRMERGFGDFKEHEGYLTDAIADEACEFIERSQDRPFFAFVSFNAVHTPMQADPRDGDLFPELSGTRRIAAQMMLSMDRACGQIIDKLRSLGLTDKTLVVFTNDNGGPMDRNGSSNFPLSGVKATQLEGGIRVPGIVAWPGKVSAGSRYDRPLSTLDLLPTFVEAAGGDSGAIDGIDGVDMLPYLAGENPGEPHRLLYWKTETRAAIREGDWKLIRFPDRPAELYNIARDPAEQDDRAAQNREQTTALMKKLFEWELTLERPRFMLTRKAEAWSAERVDTFRKPPSASY